MGKRKNIIILGNGNITSNHKELVVFGGAELQIWQLTKELNKRAYDVFFLFPGKIEESFIQNGCRILSVPGQWSSLAGIYRLLTELRRITPDIIITRAASPLLIIYVIISGIIRARLFYFAAHDWELTNGKRLSGWRWHLFRLGIHFCSMLFVQNEYQLCGFKRLLIWHKYRIVLTKNLPLLDSGKKVYKLGDYFFWIGTYRPQKRPERVVELAKRLPSHRFLIVLHCFGKEEIERWFENAIQGLKNIKFIKGVTRDQLPDLYANAMAILITSEGEGFPNVALEAWSQCKAVITTPSTALGKLTEEQGCIVLKTINDFIKVIKDKSSKELGDIGTNGLKYFERNYSKDLIMDKITSYL